MFGNDTLSTVLVAGFVVVLSVAAAGGAAVGAVAAQSGPSIGFSGVEDVSEGSTDGATVTFADVSDSDGVGSFTVNVTYDASAVSVSASGTGSFDVETGTPEPGVLRVTGYTDQYPGPTGDGSLFSLSVTGETAADSVTLGLEAETFTDADGNDLSVSTGSTTLAVEATDGGGGGGGGGSGGGGGQPGGGASGDVEIVDGVLLNDTVSTGEPVVARVDLANRDPTRGRITLTLGADGEAVTERTVAVGASSERTVYVSNRFGSPGTYSLSINGETVGSVTVEAGGTPTATQVPGTPAPTATPEPTTSPAGTPESTGTAPPGTELPATTSGDGAGFGVVAAVVAVGLALLAARRPN